ncbi:hypothetical protein JW968_05580 [Candidatus Woesearchaeota archaeon]|nr:hypothetical protein [Candidatus Woesearchaeota archaeon]
MRKANTGRKVELWYALLIILLIIPLVFAQEYEMLTPEDGNEEFCENHDWYWDGGVIDPYYEFDWEVGSGGQPGCCGNFSSGNKEAYIWKTFGHCVAENDYPGIRVQGDDPSDDACCDNQSDCVHNDVCYTSGLSYTFSGERVSCSVNDWYDCDNSANFCEGVNYCDYAGAWVNGSENHIFGEYDTGTDLECCGDDAGEYLKTGSVINGTPTNLTAPNVMNITVCCDNPNDKVGWRGDCYGYTPVTGITLSSFDNDTGAPYTNVSDEIRFQASWTSYSYAEVYFCKESNCAGCNELDQSGCLCTIKDDSGMICELGPPYSSYDYMQFLCPYGCGYCLYTAQEDDDPLNTYYVRFRDYYFGTWSQIYNSMTTSNDQYVVNHAPEAQDVHITPEDADTYTDLYCNYTFYDKDGDDEGGPVVHTLGGYWWEIKDENDVLVRNFTSPFNVLDDSEFNISFRIRCRVSVWDEHHFHDDSKNAWSSVFVVGGNHRPDLWNLVDNSDGSDSARINVGQKAEFTAYWSDSDNQDARLVICDKEFRQNYTHSGCQFGHAYCESPFSGSTPVSCTYTVVGDEPHMNISDPGSPIEYWAAICDSSGQCSVPWHDNFSINMKPTVGSLRIMPYPFYRQVQPLLAQDLIFMSTDETTGILSSGGRLYINWSRGGSSDSLGYMDDTLFFYDLNQKNDDGNLSVSVTANTTKPQILTLTTDRGIYYVYLPRMILGSKRTLYIAQDGSTYTHPSLNITYISRPSTYPDYSNLFCEVQNVTDAEWPNNVTSDILWYVIRNGQEYPYQAPSHVYVAHGNTLPGDQWQCRITPFDDHVYGDQYSTPWVTITTDDGQGGLAPYIVSYSDDSVGRTNVGDKVTFSIEWEDDADPNEQVQVYICSNSTIDKTGCLYPGSQYVYQAWTSDRTLELEYTVQPSDNGTMHYWIMICDDTGGKVGGNWLCSNFETLPGESMGNFTVNHQPQVQSIEILPSGANESDNLNCSVTLADQDDNASTKLGITYRWYLKRGAGGYVLYNTANTQYLSHGNTLYGDYWVCEATPSDAWSSGTPVNSSAAHLVANDYGKPRVHKVTDTSSDASMTSEYENITFTVDWIDEDNDAVYLYICDSQGAFASGCKARTFHESHALDSADPITATYTVPFGSAGSENYTVIVCDESYECSGLTWVGGSVFYNQRPNTTSVSITDMNGDLLYLESDNLNCSYTGADPDSNISKFRIDWFVKRASDTAFGLYFSYDNTNLSRNYSIMTNGNIEIGDQWYCSVTPHDEWVYGHSASSGTLNISDVPPATTTPSITFVYEPSTFYNPWNEGSVLPFDVFWQDDGSEVRLIVCDSPFIQPTGCIDRTIYQGSLASAYPISFNYTTRSSDNGSQGYYMMLCDEDNECSGNYDDVFYVNHEPKSNPFNMTALDSSVVDPYYFDAGTTLNCSYDYNSSDTIFQDVDDHQTEFGWFISYDNNGVFNKLPYNASTLSNQQTQKFSRYDAVFCGVKPKDVYGLKSSIFYNSSVEVIQNALPVLDVWLDNHTDYYICNYTAVDADSDPLQINFTWYLNGTKYPPAAQKLTSSWLTLGWNWTCNVSAYDGFNTTWEDSVPNAVPVPANHFGITNTSVRTLSGFGMYDNNTLFNTGEVLNFSLEWSANYATRFVMYVCDSPNITLDDGCGQNHMFCYAPSPSGTTNASRPDCTSSNFAKFDDVTVYFGLCSVSGVCDVMSKNISINHAPDAANVRIGPATYESQEELFPDSDFRTDIGFPLRGFSVERYVDGDSSGNYTGGELIVIDSNSNGVYDPPDSDIGVVLVKFESTDQKYYPSSKTGVYTPGDCIVSDTNGNFRYDAGEEVFPLSCIINVSSSLKSFAYTVGFVNSIDPYINATYSDHEPIYNDLDESGDVSAGDIRLYDPDPEYGAGSIVFGGDNIVSGTPGAGLLLAFHQLDRYFDKDKDSVFDDGEPLYADLDNDYEVSTGDIRRTSFANYGQDTVVSEMSSVSVFECKYDYVDPDGDLEDESAALFMWYKLNRTAGSYQLMAGQTNRTIFNFPLTAANRNSFIFRKDDTLKCAVSPADNYSNQDLTYENSTLMPVGNAPPYIESSVTNARPALPGEDVWLNLTVWDADSDDIWYRYDCDVHGLPEWDTALIPTGSDNADIAIACSYPDSYPRTAYVLVTDNITRTNIVMQVNANNLPPNITGVDLPVVGRIYSDNVTIRWNYTDPDADAASFYLFYSADNITWTNITAITGQPSSGQYTYVWDTSSVEPSFSYRVKILPADLFVNGTPWVTGMFGIGPCSPSSDPWVIDTLALCVDEDITVDVEIVGSAYARFIRSNFTDVLLADNATLIAVNSTIGNLTIDSNGNNNIVLEDFHNSVVTDEIGSSSSSLSANLSDTDIGNVNFRVSDSGTLRLDNVSFNRLILENGNNYYFGLMDFNDFTDVDRNLTNDHFHAYLSNTTFRELELVARQASNNYVVNSTLADLTVYSEKRKDLLFDNISSGSNVTFTIQDIYSPGSNVRLDIRGSDVSHVNLHSFMDSRTYVVGSSLDALRSYGSSVVYMGGSVFSHVNMHSSSSVESYEQSTLGSFSVMDGARVFLKGSLAFGSVSFRPNSSVERAYPIRLMTPGRQNPLPGVTMKVYNSSSVMKTGVTDSDGYIRPVIVTTNDSIADAFRVNVSSIYLGQFTFLNSTPLVFEQGDLNCNNPAGVWNIDRTVICVDKAIQSALIQAQAGANIFFINVTAPNNYIGFAGSRASMASSTLNNVRLTSDSYMSSQDSYFNLLNMSGVSVFNASDSRLSLFVAENSDITLYGGMLINSLLRWPATSTVTRYYPFRLINSTSGPVPDRNVALASSVGVTDSDGHAILPIVHTNATRLRSYPVNVTDFGHETVGYVNFSTDTRNLSFIYSTSPLALYDFSTVHSSICLGDNLTLVASLRTLYDISLHANISTSSGTLKAYLDSSFFTPRPVPLGVIVDEYAYYDTLVSGIPILPVGSYNVVFWANDSQGNRVTDTASFSVSDCGASSIIINTDQTATVHVLNLTTDAELPSSPFTAVSGKNEFFVPASGNYNLRIVSADGRSYLYMKNVASSMTPNITVNDMAASSFANSSMLLGPGLRYSSVDAAEFSVENESIFTKPFTLGFYNDSYPDSSKYKIWQFDYNGTVDYASRKTPTTLVSSGQFAVNVNSLSAFLLVFDNSVTEKCTNGIDDDFDGYIDSDDPDCQQSTGGSPLVMKGGSPLVLKGGGSAFVRPTCSDGIQNQLEAGIDCGGPCAACAPKAPSVAPSCYDGVRNQGESGIDCGGPCQPCSDLPAPAATCYDGIRNQGESGIDCGGPCAACAPKVSCSDGIQNQGESGVDCGGPCRPCQVVEAPSGFSWFWPIIILILIIVLLGAGVGVYLEREKIFHKAPASLAAAKPGAGSAAVTLAGVRREVTLLFNYIYQQLSSGFKEDMIRKAVVMHGWSPQEVDYVFMMISDLERGVKEHGFKATDDELELAHTLQKFFRANWHKGDTEKMIIPVLLRMGYPRETIVKAFSEVMDRLYADIAFARLSKPSSSGALKEGLPQVYESLWENGFTEQQLRTALINCGWKPEMIDEAMKGMHQSIDSELDKHGLFGHPKDMGAARSSVLDLYTKGFNPDHIRAVLISRGWSRDEVDEVMKEFL